jgi:hypothetical protein
MEETNEIKKYLDYDGLVEVVDNVKTYTDNAVEQKSAVQIINSGTTEVLSTLEIYKLTQEEYDKAVEDGTIVENAIYLTPDEEIDLSPYATIELVNGKADAEHSHEISDVTNLQSSLDAINNSISGKANTSHSHAISDVANLQNTLDEKVPTSRTINGKALTSNIELSASDIGAEVSGTADIQISTHNTSDAAHSDIRGLITDLSNKVNNFLDVDDDAADQLSEVLEMINNNEGTIESLTTNKVNVSDIVDNITTADATKVLSANQGVEIKKLIDALQLLVNGKSDVSHTHDDKYYTETEIEEKVSAINEEIGNLEVELKEYVDDNDASTLEQAKTYTNDAVAQKSAVQIIIWEEND